jgi:hypothetical protein
MKSSDKQVIWGLTILNFAIIALVIYGRFFWGGDGISKNVYNRAVIL